MDRKLMDAIEDNLWQVLADYAKGFKSPADVETVKHALSGIFKIKCLEGMDDYHNTGSFRGGSYDGGRSYTYYDDGMYGPHFMSRNGGSYGGSYDTDMRSKMEELMRNTTDERQRRIIQDMMAKLR